MQNEVQDAVLEIEIRTQDIVLKILLIQPHPEVGERENKRENPTKTHNQPERLRSGFPLARE
jgi:hypothetical protein